MDTDDDDVDSREFAWQMLDRIANSMAEAERLSKNLQLPYSGRVTVVSMHVRRIFKAIMQRDLDEIRRIVQEFPDALYCEGLDAALMVYDIPEELGAA